MWNTSHSFLGCKLELSCCVFCFFWKFLETVGNKTYLEEVGLWRQAVQAYIVPQFLLCSPLLDCHEVNSLLPDRLLLPQWSAWAHGLHYHGLNALKSRVSANPFFFHGNEERGQYVGDGGQACLARFTMRSTGVSLHLAWAASFSVSAWKDQMLAYLYTDIYTGIYIRRRRTRKHQFVSTGIPIMLNKGLFKTPLLKKGVPFKSIYCCFP